MGHLSQGDRREPLRRRWITEDRTLAPEPPSEKVANAVEPIWWDLEIWDCVEL